MCQEGQWPLVARCVPILRGEPMTDRHDAVAVRGDTEIDGAARMVAVTTVTASRPPDARRRLSFSEEKWSATWLPCSI